MMSEEANRITLGWSREKLARLSNVAVASVYLLERMGSAGTDDDLRIRQALAKGLAKHSDRAQMQGGVNDNGAGKSLGPAEAGGDPASSSRQ